MTDALQFLRDHGAAFLFWVVFIEQIGLPIPAIPLLIAAGAFGGRRQDECADGPAHSGRGLPAS